MLQIILMSTYSSKGTWLPTDLLLELVPRLSHQHRLPALFHFQVQALWLKSCNVAHQAGLALH